MTRNVGDSSSLQHRFPTLTRRAYLQMGGAMATSLSPALAGCSAFSIGSPQYITQIKLTPGGISAHLNTQILPDQVSLITPRGTVAEQRSVTDGQRTVEFSTIMSDSSGGRFAYSYRPLPPGTYTIAASGEGDATQELSLPLSHSVELTDLGIATDTQQGNRYPTGIIATIKNTGTLPLRIDNILFEGQIPAAADGDYDPVSSYQRLDVDDDTAVDEYMLSNKIGVIDMSDSTPTYHSVTYPSGRFKTISLSPFLYQSDPYEVADTPIKRQFCGQTVPFTLAIASPNATRRITVSVEYGSNIMSVGGPSGTYYVCTPVRIADYRRMQEDEAPNETK